MSDSSMMVAGIDTGKGKLHVCLSPKGERFSVDNTAAGIATGPIQGVDGVEISILFDFGVGANRFKKVWSNGMVKLFNLNHAVNARGQLHAGMLRLAGSARRYVKRNPRLFSAVQDARAMRARLRGQAE